MNKKTIIKLLLFLGIFIAAGSCLVLPNLALAQNCPSQTTVSGTTVIFVGELTDLGGDGTSSVWFEYGKTTSYGKTAPEKVLTQPGFYCITVSDLLPLTTYNYRAAARNSAGTSYGENKTFTTTAETIINIKANGSNGPITIPYNSSANLSWTSSNADSCYASNGWSGTKATSGSQSTGNLTSSRTYTITCQGSRGPASDSVVVNVESSKTLSVALSANPNAGCAPLNNVSFTADVSGTAKGNVTYYFDCTNNGTWNRIYTSWGSSYTASKICSYPSVGNYTARIQVEREGQLASTTRTINVYSCTESSAVNIKANGSNGPITIPYNSSANLSWTSSNADSCYASNGWSGTKATSGSQSTGNLTSSRTYTITCQGFGGSSSDSVVVNIESEATPDFIIRKTVRNVSQGTNYFDLINARPGEVLNFGIVVKAGNDPLYNMVLQDILPAGLLYRGELKIDNVLTSGDIFEGLNIGYIPAGQSKTIIFRADVAGEGSFSFGQTELANTALVYNQNYSRSDTAKVIVSKTAVAGVATEVPTGWTNNLLLDSFFLPLSASLFVIWLLKSRIIRFEEWLDERKRKYLEYKSKKVLKMKIAKTKFREAIGL